MNTTERIILNVNALMQMNGFSLSDDDKKRIQNCLIGSATFHETIQQLASTYKQGE